MERRFSAPGVVASVSVIIIVLSAVVVVGASFLGKVRPGDTQEHTIATFGPPAYFVLEYLPRDDVDEGPLVRTESWYYPDHAQVVHFIAGAATAIDDLDGDNATYLYLDPRLFDFEMTAEEIVDVLGEPAERIDDLLAASEGAGEQEADGEVYLSEHALFGVQDGVLLYLETFGDADSGGD